MSEAAVRTDLVQSWAQIFDSLHAVGRTYELAERVAVGNRRLLNRKGELGTRRVQTSDGDIRLVDFSQIPLTGGYNFHLAVGSKDTVFYQVPVVYLREDEGERIPVSGKVAAGGVSERYQTPKPLGTVMREHFRDSIDAGPAVVAAALLPVHESLGDQVFVGGSRPNNYGKSWYQLGVAGHMQGRAIVGPDSAIVPIMQPSPTGERFLAIGDVMNRGEASAARRMGLPPTITLVAGPFEEPKRVAPIDAGIPYLDHLLEGGGAMRGGPTLDAEPMRSMGSSPRVGPVRLDMGNESGVEYGKAEGRRVGVSTVVYLHVVGVNEDATPADLTRVIESLPEF